jgi:hypothetical protein
MEERYERLERSRDPRDRRLDQWLETGRQLVDGVAGRRPGQRRPGLDLDSVGRWVGDKVEWLLEEDDDWREPWQESAEPKARRKQPLQAISRRSRQRSMPSAAFQPPHQQQPLRSQSLQRLTTGPMTTCFRSSVGSAIRLSGLLHKGSRKISHLPPGGVCPVRVVAEPDIARWCCQA